MPVILGTLLKIAEAYLLLKTAEGRMRIPYTQNTQINVSYKGETLALEELIRKKVQVIILEDGTTIQITGPND